MKIKFIASVCFIMVMLSLVSKGWGYGMDGFIVERDDFVGLQNNMVRDLVGGLNGVKRITPLMSVNGMITYSFDLSFGQAISPLFYHNRWDNDYSIFKNLDTVYDSANGENLLDYNIGGYVSINGDWIGSLNFSYFPYSTGNQSVEFSKVNVNFFRRLKTEKLMEVGVYIGGGYSYTGGSINRTLDLSYTDTDDNLFRFTGDLNSNWNYHGPNLQLYIHKMLFIVNFYGNINYYWLFGSSSTSMDGKLNNESVPYLLENTDMLRPKIWKVN